MLMFLLASCDCGRKSDEERLMEQIDTTKVYVYAAAKAAIARDDPEMAAVRAMIMGLVSVSMGGHGPIGAAAPGRPVQSPEATSLVELGTALWQLRGQGQAIVRGDQDEGRPLIPALLESDIGINRATDHALLFVALSVLKLHPKSPVPMPPQIVLYEAYRTDTSELTFPIGDAVHGLRAYTYAQNELCDLAQADANALDPNSTGSAANAPSDDLSRAFVGLGGQALSTQQHQAADAGLQALAHGATAQCYFARDEPEKAREELAKFVGAAERAGASPADVALIRAYLFYSEDELAKAREQCELAKTAEWMEDDYRADIDEVIDHLDREDSDAIDRFFDRAFFGQLMFRVVLREMEKQGVFDAVADTDAAKAVRGFVEAIGGAIEGSQEVTRQAEQQVEQAADEATRGTKSLLERVTMSASIGESTAQ